MIWPFKKRDKWEDGLAGDPLRPARRHKQSGEVQFVLWPAGEQGHSEDKWIAFDRYWWPTFVPKEPK
jgi:hypothetical protein